MYVLYVFECIYIYVRIVRICHYMYVYVSICMYISIRIVRLCTYTHVFPVDIHLYTYKYEPILTIRTYTQIRTGYVQGANVRICQYF